MYLIEESRATARDFATWDFDTHSKLVRSFKFVYRSIHAEDEINSAPTLFGMFFLPATGTTHFLLGIVPSFLLGSSERSVAARRSLTSELLTIRASSVGARGPSVVPNDSDGSKQFEFCQ